MCSGLYFVCFHNHSRFPLRAACRKQRRDYCDCEASFECVASPSLLVNSNGVQSLVSCVHKLQHISARNVAKPQARKRTNVSNLAVAPAWTFRYKNGKLKRRGIICGTICQKSTKTEPMIQVLMVGAHVRRTHTRRTCRIAPGGFCAQRSTFTFTVASLSFFP